MQRWVDSLIGFLLFSILLNFMVISLHSIHWAPTLAAPVIQERPHLGKDSGSSWGDFVDGCVLLKRECVPEEKILSKLHQVWGTVRLPGKMSGKVELGGGDGAEGRTSEATGDIWNDGIR